MNKKYRPDPKNGMYIRKRTYQIDPEILSEIETKDNNEAATIIHCQYTSPEKYMNGGWVNIAQTTYLCNDNDNTMLKMKQVFNIPISPEKHFFQKPNQTKRFTLFFPALPEDWSSFSVVEVTNEPGPVLIHSIERNDSGVYHLTIE
jgi:hypothetical protein